MTRLMRRMLMLPGVAALLLGLWAGLSRLGAPAHAASERIAALHGPLMIAGFFGTLIGLERAVGIGAAWTYAGPLLSGLGALALILGATGAGGPLLAAGAAVLVAASCRVAYQARGAPYAVVIAAGAGCLLGANLVWAAGMPIDRAAPLWLSFLILTIAGERLELSRILFPSHFAVGQFLALAACTAGGGVLLAAGSGPPAAGPRVLATGLAGLSLWLLRHDLAIRLVRRPGSQHYTAVCLLGGYAWLLVAAGLCARASSWPGGAEYAAIIHAITLGFTMPMVFAHAFVILPAVADVSPAFHRCYYLPLALLHVSLIVRVAGDTGLIWSATAWGGIFNVAALLLFFSMIAAGASAKHQSPARAA